MLVLYAAFYAVNTKCEHCHAAYKRARRLSSQVVEGDDQFCLCSCCQAPSSYSDCVYCHRIEGALNLLAAVATGSGFTPDQWDDCLSRFEPPPIANIPFVRAPRDATTCMHDVRIRDDPDPDNNSKLKLRSKINTIYHTSIRSPAPA